MDHALHACIGRTCRGRQGVSPLERCASATSDIPTLWCREGLKQLEAALADYRAVLGLEPKNKEAQAKVQALSPAAEASQQPGAAAEEPMVEG